MRKQAKAQSKKLRAHANGHPCTLRIPEVCDPDPEKMMLCHLRMNGRGGTGTKVSDLEAVIACARCHDALDKRVKWPAFYDTNDLLHDLHRARSETLESWLNAGLIQVK